MVIGGGVGSVVPAVGNTAGMAGGFAVRCVGAFYYTLNTGPGDPNPLET